MGTGTFSYTENLSSSYKATWTITATLADIKASGSTVTVPAPSVTAKYVYSGKAYGLAILEGVYIDKNVNGTYTTLASQTLDYVKGSTSNPGTADFVKMTSGTAYAMTRYSSSPYGASRTVNTSVLFNASNKTSRTTGIYMRIPKVNIDQGTGYIGSSADASQSSKFNCVSEYSTSKRAQIATVTLDAPPTFKVIDSGGVETTQVSFDTSYVYAGLTTASITVSETTAYYEGTVSSTSFTIGNQTVSISGNGTLLIPLNAGGTFTPTVTVTDSRGQTTTKSLDSITVNVYTAPSVNIDVERTKGAVDEEGIPDDEGAYATLSATLTFTDAIAEAETPTVVVTNEDGNTQSSTVTWYSSRASNGKLSGSVTWENLASGDTVYGLISITNGFNTQESYTITVTPEDTEGAGTAVTQTLQTAFYTVDFLAGGHGIAFGQPSSQDGFYCNMDANFMKDVLIDLPDYQTTGTTDKAIYDACVALGWDSDVIV